MFEFVEEALDGITPFVQVMTEDRWFETIGHCTNIAPGPAFSKPFAKGVGIVSPIRQENVPCQHGVKHIFGAAPIVCLTFGELQDNGQASGIEEMSRSLLKM